MQQSSMLGSFALADEIQKFDPSDRPSGRRAEILIKTDHLRVVLVTMKQGAELQEHAAQGPITIQALSGAFTIRVDERDVDLPTGNVVSLQSNVRHAVRALADGAFLLTIGWPSDSTDNPSATSCS